MFFSTPFARSEEYVKMYNKAAYKDAEKQKKTFAGYIRKYIFAVC